jgi:hypothetical protein
MNTTEVITPEIAQRYLEYNNNNRRLDMNKVKLYAQDMKSGRWLPTSERIGFDVNGTLINGQHRLHACILANVPFTTDVVRGLPPESFAVTDINIRRNLAQVLQLAGVPNARSFVAAMNIHLLYLKCGGNRLSYNRQQEVTETEKMLLIKANQVYLLDSHSKAMAAYVQNPNITPGILTGLHYTVWRKYPQQADAFVEQLGSGIGLSSTDAVHTMRQFLLRRKELRHKQRYEYMMAIYGKAWNAHVTGMPVKWLKWLPEEAFPTLIR